MGQVLLWFFGGVVALALASSGAKVLYFVLGGTVAWLLGRLVATNDRVRQLEETIEKLHQMRRSTPATPATQAEGAAASSLPAPPALIETPPPASPASGRPSGWSAPHRAAADATEPAPVLRNAQPVRPVGPTPASPIVQLIKDFFLGGNALVRSGIVILFIGVAFLLRYLSERTHVPIELRLAGVAAGAFVLFGLGWRLRKRRPGYALALQGGAFGILYLTVFVALRLFKVLPPTPAFVLLVVISVLAVAMAVMQDSLAFAALGVGCGFLAPILASTGQGDHVVLFGYYVVLNVAILGIAWFKAWRLLNVMGAVFTFGIGAVWGVLRYETVLFASTEPFLIAFLLMYIVVAVLFSARRATELKDAVDGTLVFGVPAAALALQWAMVHHWEYIAAISAAAMGLTYLTLAAALRRYGQATQQLLVYAFVGVGIAALTVAVPLALDDRWTTGVWALEGAALVWLGCRQSSRWSRATGVLLQLAAGILLLLDRDAVQAATPVLNVAFLGRAMLVVAGLYSAVRLRGAQVATSEGVLGPLMFLWAAAWFLVAGGTEIHEHVARNFRPAGFLVLICALALCASEAHRRWHLAEARWLAWLPLPALLAFAVYAVFTVSHPFMDGGAWAVPAAFAIFYLLCRRHEGTVPGSQTVLHALSGWLLLALLSWELGWRVDQWTQDAPPWSALTVVALPLISLVVLPRAMWGTLWPFGPHSRVYLEVVCGGIAVALGAWTLWALPALDGGAAPLPFVPLLNAVDLTQVVVLVALAGYVARLKHEELLGFARVTPLVLAWGCVLLTFFWLNAALLRTIHHWLEIAYELDALLDSTFVQTSLSIFWTLIALVSMVAATRRGSRPVWLVGAALLGVVVAKLLFVDLASSGTIERIVSFVGVGVLMLVMGYFSPLPPARERTA